MSFDQLVWSWTPDLGPRSVPMSSGQFLPVAHLPLRYPSGAAGGREAGSCGASHLSWGGDFYMPPPSSSVFFCSQYSLGLSHSRSASKACAPQLFFFTTFICTGIEAEGDIYQACRWRTEAHGWFRTYLEHRMEGSSSHRPEEQYSC